MISKKPKKKYLPVKKILFFAGVGAFIAATLVMPGLPIILKGKSFRFEDFFPEEEWEGYDKARLRQKLKDLYKRKMVEVYQCGEKFTVQITEKGKKKLLKYKLNELDIPEQDKWDGKWRIVAYDVPKEKKRAGDGLRFTLKKWGFLELQKSVYLFPYPCNEAIEFVREIYEIGEHVTTLTVGYLENEEAYKKYFDL